MFLCWDKITSHLIVKRVMCDCLNWTYIYVAFNFLWLWCFELYKVNCKEKYTNVKMRSLLLVSSSQVSGNSNGNCFDCNSHSLIMVHNTVYYIVWLHIADWIYIADYQEFSTELIWVLTWYYIDDIVSMNDQKNWFRNYSNERAYLSSEKLCCIYNNT